MAVGEKKLSKCASFYLLAGFDFPPWFSLLFCSQTDGDNREEVSNVSARCSVWCVQIYCVLNFSTSEMKVSSWFTLPIVIRLHWGKNTSVKPTPQPAGRHGDPEVNCSLTRAFNPSFAGKKRYKAVKLLSWGFHQCPCKLSQISNILFLHRAACSIPFTKNLFCLHEPPLHQFPFISEHHEKQKSRNSA